MDRHSSEPLVADLASEWLASTKEPVFAMVHTQGAHSPYHSPPAWNRHRDETAPRRADYLNLVEFVDTQLGRFLDRLPEDAVIVVTSDHGEALGESDECGHQREEMDLLYEVPLIAAGASPPFSESEQVTHLDINEWLRQDIAPTQENQRRPAKLQKRLEALGYADGTHSA